jgi:hypothetical protein
MQVVFHFQYQKHVYVRNGHIVIGFEFWGGGANVTGHQQKKYKSSGVFLFILGIMMWGHGNCQILLCTYRYMYVESFMHLPYPLSSFATTCRGSWPLKVRFIFKNFLTIVRYNLMFCSSENGKSTSYWN